MNRRGRPERDLRIEIVVPEFRGPRRQVGNARLHADAVPDFEPADAGADFDDSARGLVPQHHGRLDDE